MKERKQDNTQFEIMDKIKIKKEELTFLDGYATVYIRTTAKTKYNHLETLPMIIDLYGIVNENLDFILPLSWNYRQIKNMGNKNFIIETKTPLDTFHIKIKKDHIEKSTQLWSKDYTLHQNNIIQLNNRFYDIEKGNFIKTYFTKIEPFKKINNMLCAVAFIELEHITLMCFINHLGASITNYISIPTNENIEKVLRKLNNKEITLEVALKKIQDLQEKNIQLNLKKHNK